MLTHVLSPCVYFYSCVHLHGVCMHTGQCPYVSTLGSWLVYWLAVRPVRWCCGVCAVSLDLCLGCWEQSGRLMNDLSEGMRSGALDASMASSSLPRWLAAFTPSWLETSFSLLSQCCTKYCVHTFCVLHCVCVKRLSSAWWEQDDQ